MTDSAGTPAGPENPDVDGRPTGAPEAGHGDTADERPTRDGTGTADEAGPEDPAEPAEPAEAAPHDPGGQQGGQRDDDASATTAGIGEQPRRKRHLLRWIAVGTAVVVLATAGAGWWFYQKLDGNITTDDVAAAELKTYEKERPAPVVLDAENILLIGSDSRAGDNDKYGQDEGSQRSDTTILLHLAADRQSATAVSIPRDLMVDIPSCSTGGNGRSKAQFAQFNWAFQFGGTACTIRTVEKLTGIRVDHNMVIDFHGFKDMVDAVDGVDVCLKDPVDDRQAHLKLPAGRQKLTGEQALGFVRARHGIGDGSDTQRMDRQQRFLGALFKKVQSNGVLLNPTRLYPVLSAATKSLTTDPGLDSLKDLYDLARSMRSVPTEKVQFLTVPRQPYTYDPNRDELVQPAADTLFEQLLKDEPVSVSPGGTDDDFEEGASANGAKPGSTNAPAPGPNSAFTGTNAAAGMCG